MKKQLGLLISSSGILLFGIAGCGANRDQQVICSGDIEGTQVTSILRSDEQGVYKEIYEERTDIQNLGYDSITFDETQEQEILKQVSSHKYDISKLQDVKGVHLWTSLDGNDFVFTLEINYEDADMDVLKELHFVEGNQLDLGISLEKTQTSYEKMGLRCNRKKDN